MGVTPGAGDAVSSRVKRSRNSPLVLRGSRQYSTLPVARWSALTRSSELDNKLDQVETAVAASLVRDSARRAEPVVKTLRASHPRGLPGDAIKVLDGNHGSSTGYRLKECGAPGQPRCLARHRSVGSATPGDHRRFSHRGQACPGT